MMMNQVHPGRSVIALAAAGVLIACAPTAEVSVPSPTRDVRQQPPPPLPERALEFPPFREMQLENGLRIIVVEHSGQPLANVSLYVRSGAAAESAELAGLAGMVAELVTKGTATRSATEIAETIERVGGQLNSSAGNDWLTVSSSVLTDHLPLAFELIGDVALRPTFPDEEVAVTRRRTLSGLQAQLGQPGTIAQRQFLRDVYGVDHPYGVSPIPGTVEAISRDDLVRFHTDHFTADNALLVVSGVVDATGVEALARQHFGEWRRGAPVRAALPQPPVRQQTRIALVHRPGSVQSNIRLGHLAIRPDNPDYFPLTVLNNIVGGGTDARLFQILREERGWTYGAYSQLTRPVDIGYFAAQAEVRTEVTDSALSEMLRQLHRIRDERVPADEFEGAKSFLAGSFPLRIETAGQIAGQIATARLLGLPIEYMSEFPQRIMAVTVDDVQRVAREYVRPDRASIVVVGDAREVLPMIEAIAPVDLYDIEGAPLQREAIEVRAATEQYQGQRLQPGTRTYRLVVQDNPMGTVTDVLARDGDVWVATSNTEAPGTSQEVEVRFSAADMTPISSTSRMSQAGTSIEADLQYADGRVTGRLELPEPMGGSRDVDHEVPQGTLLPGMDSYIMAVADLAEGRSLTLPVFDMMSGSVTSVTMTVTGVESVTVPAGTFSTYRVELTGGPQAMTVFVRQEAPHIMVRQEFAGAPIAVELQSLD
jgi:zinc protease